MKLTTGIIITSLLDKLILLKAISNPAVPFIHVVVNFTLRNLLNFVSRFFTPQSSIFEDPVTGSSHCSLIPYWSKRLNKKKLKSIQISERTGILECEAHKNHVLISGKAKTYLKGKIFI